MPLLKVENLCKSFDNSSGFFFSGRFKAVNNASFTLDKKQTLAWK